MAPIIILLAIIAVPAVILFIFRINAALVFLSLCLGDVLTRYVASGTQPAAAKLLNWQNQSSWTLTLLLLPAILTAIFMVRTVKSRHKLLNVLPAVGVGLLAAILVVPLLPPELGAKITGLSLWQSGQNVREAIVGLSALASLLLLWLQRPKAGGKEHAKKAH